MVLFIPFPGLAQEDPGRLSVTIWLRAALNDGVDVCADDFGANERDARRARSVARGAIDPLGVRGARIEFDPGLDSKCVFVRVAATLTRPGPRSHERVFFFDPDPLARYAVNAGYKGLDLHVCYPAVRVEAEGSWRGGNAGCEQRGLLWTGTGTIGVSFRATGGTLARGVLGTASFWLLIVVGLRIVRRTLNRNDRWAWFLRNNILGWLSLGVPVLFLSFFWSLLVAYWTNLIPSLQLLVGIGVPGEVAITGAPPIGLALATLGARTRGIGAVLMRHPELRPEEGVAAWPDGPKPLEAEMDRQALLMEAIYIVPFGLLFLFAQGPFSDVVGVIGALVVSIGILFLDAFVFDAALIRSHKAMRMQRFAELPLVERLRSLGFNTHSAWVSSDPIRLIREFGSSTAPLGAGTIVRHSVIVWERVAEVPGGLLSGGLAAGYGFSPLSFLALAGPAFTAMAQADAGRTIVPWPIIGALGAAAVYPFVRDLAIRRRALRRAAARPDALDLLKGMLYFARIAARSIQPLAFPRFFRRFRSQFDPHRRFVAAHAKRARRFASRAGISPERFEAAVAEIAGLDEA